MAPQNMTLTGSYGLTPFKKKYDNTVVNNNGNAFITKQTPISGSMSLDPNKPNVKSSAPDLTNYFPKTFSDNKPSTPTILGSYMNNLDPNKRTPSPYKTVSDVTVPTPPVDNTVKVPTALDSYLASIGKLSNDQIKNENTNFADLSTFETNQANDQNKALLDSLGDVKNSLDSYTTSTNKNRDNSKVTAENQYGLQQLQTAKTRAESEARNRNRFAALNTSDSAGAGSYDSAQSNVESEFNKDTQTILQAKQSKLDEIDSLADTNIQNELTKYNTYVRSVNSNINLNNETKAKNIAAAKYALNTNIGNIKANIENLKYQNLSTGDGQLSENFLKTGVPTTAAEVKFLQANKDAFAKIGAGTNAGNQKAVGIIQNLIDADTKGITGLNFAKWQLGDSSRSAAGLLKQLSSELQIEEAKRFKGQGSMSDAERQILANSIAAFNLDSKNGMPQVSDERFKQILTDLKTGFNNKTTGASASSNVVTAPDGQQITIVD